MRAVHFVHIRLFSAFGVMSMQGGCTVRVTGEQDGSGVDVQVAYCKLDKKKPDQTDVYCKKEGRRESLDAPIKTMPLRSLPQEIKAIAEKYAKQHKAFVANIDYSYTMKYFLPKE